MRPVLLDLYCGAGGAAVGYHRAGFDVIGVDVDPQPNYPFEFHQSDALSWMEGVTGRMYDAIHASPPCQFSSTQTADRSKHTNFIPATRLALQMSGLPYVIENVEGANKHLIDPIRLCGSSFGMDVRRHRYFEANWPIQGKPCEHGWQTPRFRSLAIKNVRAGKLATVVGVHGHINYVGEFPIRCKAMGIDWMTNDELVESIPPTYTEWIGGQLIRHLMDARTLW